MLEDLQIAAGSFSFAVPAGFISDGASVPRAFWSFCAPFDGRYLEIYILHDFLYSSGALSRYEADRMLLEGLIERGMPVLKARIVYRAVRLFGESHFSK